MTEKSTGDDNDGCNDNYDGHFDDNDDKNDQKNIQISWLLSKNVPILETITWWKKDQKIRAWSNPPPLSGNARK